MVRYLSGVTPPAWCGGAPYEAGGNGGSAPPPVRLRRLRGRRAGAPAGAPQLSLPAGVAPSNQSLRTIPSSDVKHSIQRI